MYCARYFTLCMFSTFHMITIWVIFLILETRGKLHRKWLHHNWSTELVDTKVFLSNVLHCCLRISSDWQIMRHITIYPAVLRINGYKLGYSSFPLLNFKRDFQPPVFSRNPWWKQIFIFHQDCVQIGCLVSMVSVQSWMVWRESPPDCGVLRTTSFELLEWNSGSFVPWLHLFSEFISSLLNDGKNTSLMYLRFIVGENSAFIKQLFIAL